MWQALVIIRDQWGNDQGIQRFPELDDIHDHIEWDALHGRSRGGITA